MTEEECRGVLGDIIRPDKTLFCQGHYVAWEPDSTVCLDDHFTIEELEAIVWWVRHHE